MSIDYKRIRGRLSGGISMMWRKTLSHEIKISPYDDDRILGIDGRRSNVVIRGITEPQQESNADCERSARDFFKDQLKLSDDVMGPMKFERCHRLGNRAAFRRPVIVRFSNYKDKLIVWDAKFKLTDHRFSVSDNFSRDTEFRRRKLFAIYKRPKLWTNLRKEQL